MLKIMENEEEIFRAWLKKHVKYDRVITGTKLAKLIGVPGPTITAYHSGRMNDNGERKFTRIPYSVRKKISEVTNTPYEEILKAGRAELAPYTTPDVLSEKVSDMEDALKKLTAESKNRAINDLEGHHISKHQKLVLEFSQAELAFDINHKLVELERLAPTELEEINDIIDIKLRKFRRLPGKALGEEEDTRSA